jgi:hypothetical protein
MGHPCGTHYQRNKGNDCFKNKIAAHTFGACNNKITYMLIVNRTIDNSLIIS